MKHNILYKVYGLALAALTLTACTDSFLDKAPDERTEIDAEDKVIGLLVNSYPSANYGWIGEVSSDNIMDQNAMHLPASTNSKQEPTRYNLTSYGREDDELFKFEPVKSSTSSDTPANLWESFYEAVNSVNEALNAIEEITDGQDANLSAKLRAARGEGLLIRAYCHFILVNVFSQAYKDDEQSRKDIGVPYVTETVSDFETHYDRSNVTETYNRIRQDLEQGLKDISDVNFEAPKYHFNTQAAHAFAARFYLFTRNYDKVIEHANQVLGTDNTQLLPKMFDYTPLDDCSYLDDFANVWQSPYIFNNLLLIDTYSIIARRPRSHRYVQGGLVARAIYYHNMPLWSRWIGNPTAFVSGLFGSGYESYYPSWIGEQFQYTDKVAGIGYAHSIRREFTAAELLLERAEAKAMTGDLEGASSDLITYHTSTMNFSEANKITYQANNGSIPLTDAIIHSWFGNGNNYNCFENWDFTAQHVSPSFVVPADAVPYMNCVNYWRRFETNFTGKRFFDLKRWGIEWTHEYGPQNTPYTMTWDDPRRAIEVPQDAIAVGLQPSRPLTVDSLSTAQSVPYNTFWGIEEN